MTADERKDLTKETSSVSLTLATGPKKLTLDLESLTTWTHALQREREIRTNAYVIKKKKI